MLGPHRLRNRLVALPVFTGYAHPGGWVSSLLVNHYKELACTGVGAVVVANAAVAADGVASTHNLRADDDDFLPGLRKIADAIKGQGAVACLQLNHCGRFAKTEQPLLPASLDTNHMAFNIASLKHFMEFFPFEKRFALTRYFLQKIGTWRRGMDSGDLERVRTAFGDAAERACRAGFDMIELHGANGYLLNQFLSAFTNKVPSEFGGDFRHRAAFPLAVIREVKKRIPASLPLGFRINVREMVPGGIDIEEAVSYAKMMESEGVAYLSASSGSFLSIFAPDVMKRMSRPAYLREDMARLTREVGIPTIISGRVLTSSIAEGLLEKGVADLIGLGRPLRVEREWVRKSAQGQKVKVCINCNGCLKRVVLEQGFNCRRWPKMERERTDLEHKLLKRNFRGVLLAANPPDLQVFQSTLPFLLPDRKNISTVISPTVLFLGTLEGEKIPHAQRDAFLQWFKESLSQLGFVDAEIRSRGITVRESADREAHGEMGAHGVIFLCRNRNQPWRERLMYRVRGKVVALLGSSPHISRILVPVDLSETTHLVLMFLGQSIFGKQGLRFQFVHVLNGPEGAARQRWEKIKAVTGVQTDLDLTLLPTGEGIAERLLEMVKEGNYGTIVMGKRGRTGIKRWLLGSVSAGVLRGLRDQSLYLID